MPARAVVLEWTLAKLSAYEQTASNLAPIAPWGRVVSVEFSSDDPFEFTSVALAPPTGEPTSLDDRLGGKEWAQDLGFVTSAELEAAFPSGEYTLQATTAGSDTIDEKIALRAGGVDSIPYFTGPVFEILSGVNPSRPITLQWNEPGVEVNRVSVRIAPISTGPAPAPIDATGQTSLELPAGTLAPNTTYSLTLEFASDEDDPRDGFSAGDGKSALANATEILFTTGDVPEPGGMWLLVGIVGGNVVRRRRAP